MEWLMKIFLLFLSSLFAYTAQATEVSVDSITESTQHFSFQLTTPKATLSGILITRQTGDEIIGSMINEFGISAIDFSYNKKNDKIKLLSVVSFLNKWYIKMVLRKDLKVCLHQLYNIPLKKTKGYIIEKGNNDITINNQKHHLTYSFSPLIVQTTNDTE